MRREVPQCWQRWAACSCRAAACLLSVFSKVFPPRFSLPGALDHSPPVFGHWLCAFWAAKLPGSLSDSLMPHPDTHAATEHVLAVLVDFFLRDGDGISVAQCRGEQTLMWVHGLRQAEGDAVAAGQGPGSSRNGPERRSKGVVFVVQIVSTVCYGCREEGKGASAEARVEERRGERRGPVSQVRGVGGPALGLLARVLSYH